MVVATLAVITFSFVYVAGVYAGKYLEHRWEVENTRTSNTERESDERKRATRLATDRYDYIVRCTEQQKRLNAIRRQANENGDLALEPLMAEQVCIALPDGASDEMPLVSLVGTKGFVPLSAETETKHYKFLERCSIEQATAIARSRNSSAEAPSVPDLIDIGQVCPAIARSTATDTLGGN